MVKDHLGNEYSSIVEMCAFYGMSDSTFRQRIRAGKSKAEALTEPTKKGKPCKDHLGNVFSSINQMCVYHGIEASVFSTRINKYGWDVKSALTEPIQEQIRKNDIEDHKGNVFQSKMEMCRFWEINYDVFRKRINDGWKLEKALTYPVENITYKDHIGNEYKSTKEMCEFWGVNLNTYKHRIDRGWSLKKALEVKVEDTSARTDHLGVVYSNVSSMCKAWGIKKVTYHARLRNGNTKEQALTTPIKRFTKTKIRG